MLGALRSRRGLLVLAIAAVLAAVLLIVLLPGGAKKSVAAPPPSVPPPPTGTPTPAVTTPPAPVVPHDVVAKAGPTKFRISGPAFTITAHVCAMKNERPLDPPGEQHHTVCWVRNEFGEAPSSNSATTYVLGHSWAENSLEVLNKLSAPATKQILAAKAVARDGVPTFPVTVLNGYTLTLWTPTGVLTYRVHDAYGVDKYKLGDVTSTMDDTVRNRVVLITCAERAGRDYNYNVIVNAYLVSSKSASSKSVSSKPASSESAGSTT